MVVLAIIYGIVNRLRVQVCLLSSSLQVAERLTVYFRQCQMGWTIRDRSCWAVHN